MVKINIPKELPDCELLGVLAGKASQRRDIDFDFFAKLNEFRQRVSGEVRQINELFPEYTPHDEQYHLKRLFHVADIVLGRNRLEAMNSAELFILAIALYGHDWGMAVSRSGKDYIVAGELTEDTKPRDLSLLRDERDRFTKFAREQRLTMDADGCAKGISIEMWREYVRQTHAYRSGERVRRFFEPTDGGVAEAASRVCVSHWLDFEDLQDYRSYPPDFSVLRETVNLRAVAVYLRLVDLLDLAEDRTPYVIWKFVAPRDPRSKMEWKKHRALQPVTCPQYQEGRVIRVDGSTDDHEVYAALEDLRVWCQEQLLGCNDILARMNDPRHKLDLYHIDWRVAARGFKPVPTQFEFNRERMFEILGDEIYQSDPYVFLRELLQNSIDAIRMRRQVLQRKGVDPGDLGVIHVTVEHGERGDAIVTWRDDGIGMDEYVVRNYLAVAGKSYYCSTDFEREGLKMDPISRFGVGILSCFMVADRIEIDTFKDPYLPPGGEPLRIIIPAIHRQFRIETRPQEGARVGTTVRVFVDGKRIPSGDESNPVKPLYVTRYLSIVAGFVEFPIVVTEGDRKTIVLHPKQDAHAARKRFNETFEVQQLDLDYLWSEAILVQDLPTAREMLQEVRLDLDSDLGLKEYEGVLAYLVPVKEVIDATSHDHERGTEFIVRHRARHFEKRVRCRREWIGIHLPRGAVGVSRSSYHSPTYAVYRDGILLPEASPPIFRDPMSYDRPVLPAPRLVVNLPKSRSPRIDLGRTQLVKPTEHWASRVLQAHLRYISKTCLKNLLALDPAERWYQLGRLVAFGNIAREDLWAVFPEEHWPVLFLDTDGRLRVLEWKEVRNGPIRVAPDLLNQELGTMMEYRWLWQKEYRGPLTRWGGERCFVTWSYGGRAVIRTAAALQLLAGRKSHWPATIQFLHPPWKGDPPLAQTVQLPTEVCEKPTDIKALLEKAVQDPNLLHGAELAQLDSLLDYRFPETIGFDQPFEHSFAYGGGLWNLKHATTQALIRLGAALELAKNRRTLPSDTLGHLEDALTNVLEMSHTTFYAGVSRAAFSNMLNNKLRCMWSLAHETRLFNVGDIEHLLPSQEEFVPGTIGAAAEKLLEGLRKGANIARFGKLLVRQAA